MAFPRSLLFTPGNRTDLLGKIDRFSPDAAVIDLEDAVPIQVKEQARDDVAKMLPSVRVPVIVRVNSEPRYLSSDLEAVVSRHVIGIMLPMANSVEFVKHVDQAIAEIERKKGLGPDSVRLFLSIETPLAVLRCFDLICAAKRVETVVFGGAEDGDLQRQLKCSWSVEGTELLYARSKVLLEARAAGIDYVLDGAFSRLDDLDAFRADCLISRRLGYDGRTLINPRQLPIAREVYAPSEAQLEYYRGVVQAFQAAEAKGLAAISFRGKLIDYAMYKKAQAFLATGG